VSTETNAGPDYTYPEPGIRQHGDDVDEVQDDVPIHKERLIR
jgi:hypothetical protein